MPDVKRRKVRHGCVLIDGSSRCYLFVGWESWWIEGVVYTSWVVLYRFIANINESNQNRWTWYLFTKSNDISLPSLGCQTWEKKHATVFLIYGLPNDGILLGQGSDPFDGFSIWSKGRTRCWRPSGNIILVVIYCWYMVCIWIIYGWYLNMVDIPSGND